MAGKSTPTSGKLVAKKQTRKPQVYSRSDAAQRAFHKSLVRYWIRKLTGEDGLPAHWRTTKFLAAQSSLNRLLTNAAKRARPDESQRDRTIRIGNIQQGIEDALDDFVTGSLRFPHIPTFVDTLTKMRAATDALMQFVSKPQLIGHNRKGEEEYALGQEIWSFLADVHSEQAMGRLSRHSVEEEIDARRLFEDHAGYGLVGSALAVLEVALRESIELLSERGRKPLWLQRDLGKSLAYFWRGASDQPPEYGKHGEHPSEFRQMCSMVIDMLPIAEGLTHPGADALARAAVQDFKADKNGSSLS